MKESPKKGSELSKCDEEGAQVAQRDTSKAVKAAKAKPSTVDSDIQGTGDGSEDDNDGNLDDVGGEDLDSDGDQGENSEETERKSDPEGTANKKTGERDYVEDQDLGDTRMYKHFPRSKRKFTIASPKLKQSQVEMGTVCRSKEGPSRSEKVTCRSIKVEKDDVDGDREPEGIDDDDDDDGDDDDGDDDWKPDQEDEGMEQEDEEEEEKMETDGAKEERSVAAEGQEGQDACVCQKCAAIFYTTWDYDLHAIDCTLAEDRTEYKCDMCRRKCTTKWGITYHLVAKHKMSGTEALAKVPELDVRKMKNKDGKRKRSRRRRKGPDARENSAGEGGMKNGDKEIEKNQLKWIVNNTPEQMCVEGSEGMTGAANEDETRGPSDVPQKYSVDPKKTCKVCLMELPNQSALYAHTRVHFGLVEDYKCSTCGQDFTKRVKFKSHVKMHWEKARGINYKCNKCDKAFSSNEALINHCVVHEKGRSSFKCDQCNKVFSHRSSLWRHVHEQHKRTRLFPCSQCDKVYFQKMRLTAHAKTHSDLREWKCDLCEKVFITRGSLNESGPFLCDLCGATYNKNSTLSRHCMNVHEGIKNYQCTYCGKMFSRNSLLKRHEEYHTVPKPHQCNICGGEFRFLYEYYSHVNEHRGIQQLKFSCIVCHKVFSKRGNLDRHTRKVHEKQDKLFCDECNFESPQYKLLERHIFEEHNRTKNSYKGYMSIHRVPVIRYKCTECGDGYKSYQKYKKHMADKHKIKLSKNWNPSETKRLKSSAAEEDNATQSLPKLDEEEKATEGDDDVSSQEPILQPGISTSVIVVEEQDVEPTLAIIQMLCPEQHDIHTVQVQTS